MSRVHGNIGQCCASWTYFQVQGCADSLFYAHIQTGEHFQEQFLMFSVLTFQVYLFDLLVTFIICNNVVFPNFSVILSKYAFLHEGHSLFSLSMLKSTISIGKSVFYSSQGIFYEQWRLPRLCPRLPSAVLITS